MVALFAPTVVVNDVPVGIKPNSLTYTEGFGERKTRVTSSGGSQTTRITSEDLETQKSRVKFMLYTTDDNVTLIRGWQANGGLNAVSVTDKGGFTRFFGNAIIINDPEITLGVDGEVEVHFEADRAV